jgi:hypothetical protein
LLQFVLRFLLAVLLATPMNSVLGQLHASPDSARIHTADIAHFWDVVDHATTLDLTQRFQRDYLDAGSRGLRIFAPAKLGTAFDLAKQLYNERPRYDSVRAATLRASEAESGIRVAFRKLDTLYPRALFPDVYFLVGRFALGGWQRDSAIMIATELYHSPSELVAVVAHEVVHTQQPVSSPDHTLLERSFMEGSADFIGELISGATINAPAQAYGRAHERELWNEFRRVMNAHDFGDWLYQPGKGGRPRDLGYFIGYRIAESYYRNAKNKSAALSQIVAARNVKRILDGSRYAP